MDPVSVRSRPAAPPRGDGRWAAEARAARFLALSAFAAALLLLTAARTNGRQARYEPDAVLALCQRIETRRAVEVPADLARGLPATPALAGHTPRAQRSGRARPEHSLPLPRAPCA